MENLEELKDKQVCMSYGTLAIVLPLVLIAFAYFFLSKFIITAIIAAILIFVYLKYSK